MLLIPLLTLTIILVGVFFAVGFYDKNNVLECTIDSDENIIKFITTDVLKDRFDFSNKLDFSEIESQEAELSQNVSAKLKTSNKLSRPWDIDVKICYKDKVYNYRLSDHIENLDAFQLQNRGVYLGKKGKKQIVDQLKNEFDSDLAYLYIFAGFNDILKQIEGQVNYKSNDATVKFTPNNSEKFVYTKEKVGLYVDRESLFKQMLNAVGTSTTINLPTKNADTTTVEDLKKQTLKRGSFTTTFYNSGPDRIHNVALAAKTLNGTIIEAGETFSFNKTVGNRTEERGYKTAKVILDGNYTDGVGGGVCQVSTTLYNALLLADLPVTSVYQHTLVPSYVKPSFDAMVSFGHADLCFLNNTDRPIYIEAKTKDKAITFTIYGVRNPYTIERESVEIERKKFETMEVVDSKKYPDLIYTDDIKVLTNGSDGVKSQGVLKYYQNGKLVKTKNIRKNNYKVVNKKIARGDKIREVEVEEY